MIMRGRIAIALVAGLLLASAPALGDPAPTTPSTATGPLHLQSSSHVVTQGGSERDLPPGYFLTEPQWDALDLEVHRLQDSETRLKATNDSLTKSMDGWQPGWITLAITTVTSIALGVYLAEKL